MVYFFPFIAPMRSKEMSFDVGVKGEFTSTSKVCWESNYSTWWGHQGRGRLWAETLAYK